MAVDPDPPPVTLVTGTHSGSEVADPGFGLVTVTHTLVLAWAGVAVPVAVNCIADTNIVCSAVPPKFTCAPETNFVPLTLRVKGPTGNGFGETELITGMGFSRVTMALPLLVVSATLVAVTVT